MTNRKALILVVLAIVWFAGCMKKTSTSSTTPGMLKVTGTITYLQRSALPPDAMVEVQLQDVSRQDVAATVVNEQTILNPGQVPISFAVDYDPAKIDQQHTYAIQARILFGGELQFINTTAYQVITHGNPTKVDVVVEPAK